MIIILTILVLSIIIILLIVNCFNNKSNFSILSNNEIRYFNKIPFIYLSIFIKNNKLYLICPIYNKKIDIQKLNIINNGEKLKLYKNFYTCPDGPCEIIIYDIQNNNNNLLSLNYFNNNKVIRVENIKCNKKKGIAITTLFKDDYKLFNIFYEYYKKQGISHFYMYYNSQLDNNVKSLFNKQDVTLLEWNYIHRNYGKNRHNKYNSGYKSKYEHHAQPPQMHDALYKFGKDNYEYMIFCDLDEYIYFPNFKIIDYVYNNNNIDCFKIDCYLSNTLDLKIPKKLPNKFKFGEKVSNISKCIYKTDNIKLLGVHKPFVFEKEKCNLLVPEDAKMFHFQNFNNKKIINYKTNQYYNINFPKIVFFSVKDKLPNNILNYNIKLNPNYTHKVYNDLDIKNFLINNYDIKFLNFFNKIKKLNNLSKQRIGPILSDFFRICILFIYGGIYLDSDIELLVNYDEFIENDADFITTISSNNKLNPHLIICKPNNIIIKDCIEQYKNLFDYNFINNNFYDKDYWMLSITNIMTKSYHKFKNKLNIQLLDEVVPDYKHSYCKYKSLKILNTRGFNYHN